MKLFGTTIGKKNSEKKPALDTAALIRRASKVIGKVKLVAVMLIFLSSIAYMLLLIGSLSNADPTEEQITEATSGVKKVRIKPEDISRIEALKDTNVEVKSIIEENRTNPFK